MERNGETAFVLALTGPAGSGKSRILELLARERGARVIQTDLVARELEEPGQPGYRALMECFGPGLAGEDGRLRKDILTRMVFESDKDREKVNRLIHPLVWERVRQQAGEGDGSILAVESAILPENPGDFFHEIWYVYTSGQERIRRLRESRGYSMERCLRMMASQPSHEEYLKNADHVIDNHGSMEDVRAQIDRWLRQ